VVTDRCVSFESSVTAGAWIDVCRVVDVGRVVESSGLPATAAIVVFSMNVRRVIVCLLVRCILLDLLLIDLPTDP